MRFEKFKKPALSAVAFFGTLGAVSIGYSAYVSNYPAAATAGVTTLSATEWNKMVTALQTLDNNLSNLSFSGGRVGIGASSPATKLHIIGPAITGAPWIGEAVRMESSSYPGNYASLFIDMSGVSSGLSFGMNGNRSLYVANSGNVGIGMTTPQNALHVSGNIGATGWVGAGCETNCSDVASGYSILYADGWGRAT
ncbi:MAG: hypothetical protein QG650_629 [Patescibacteria group bacterium]|nr:hypothetical protein [Patescibacteria group bacterium]